MSNASSDPIPAAPKPAQDQESWQKVPWGPAAAIVASGLGFILSQVVAAVALTVLGAAGLYQMPDWLDTILGQFVFVLLSESLIVLCLWLFIKRRRGNWRQLGLGRRPRVNDAGHAVAGFVIYFVILLLAMSLLGWLTNINLDQKQELGFDNVLDSGGILLAFVSLVILPPVVEEIVFRGFLFAGLRKKLTFGWAALFTSLIFAGPHLLASSHGLLWAAGIDTFLLSLMLCYLRQKTGALWAPIMVHALKNGLAFIFYIGLVSA